MRTALAVIAAFLLLAVPAQAKTKTTRIVPGHGAVEWSVGHHYAHDAQVYITVYVDGHDVPGRAVSGQTSTYTRGKRTVTVIARNSRFDVRVANYARSQARVTMRVELIG